MTEQIIVCETCGVKNRIQASPERLGNYRCGSCKSLMKRDEGKQEAQVSDWWPQNPFDALVALRRSVPTISPEPPSEGGLAVPPELAALTLAAFAANASQEIHKGAGLGSPESVVVLYWELTSIALALFVEQRVKPILGADTGLLYLLEVRIKLLEIMRDDHRAAEHADAILRLGFNFYIDNQDLEWAQSDLEQEDSLDRREEPSTRPRIFSLKRYAKLVAQGRHIKEGEFFDVLVKGAYRATRSLRVDMSDIRKTLPIYIHMSSHLITYQKEIVGSLFPTFEIPETVQESPGAQVSDQKFADSDCIASLSEYERFVYYASQGASPSEDEGKLGLWERFMYRRFVKGVARAQVRTLVALRKTGEPAMIILERRQVSKEQRIALNEDAVTDQEADSLAAYAAAVAMRPGYRDSAVEIIRAAKRVCSDTGNGLKFRSVVMEVLYREHLRLMGAPVHPDTLPFILRHVKKHVPDHL